MADPAVCPRCDGEREVYDARSGGRRKCPACKGEGVVWPPSVSEAAEQPESDPLDLTFRK